MRSAQLIPTEMPAHTGAIDTVKTTDLIDINDAVLINTYGTRKLSLVRGEGMHLWDAEGNEYLDFFAGIAVVGLGHCHPAVTEAICEQARTLVHVSNLYYIEPQVRLARLLAEHTFAARWFFCNSGAEANEAAIKLARRYWSQQETPKPVIIAADQSFHGRTYAALTATGQSKYHEGFGPLVPGFAHVPYGDVAAMEQALTPDTGAILLEPIQGEGGVRVPPENYLQDVRALCDEHNVLLILDEVQTGMGRTGALFAHEHTGITPDIMTVAKALGNGVPIGGLGCTEKVSSGFGIGSHAATFGGNPLCCAASVATLEEVVAPGFIEDVAEKGKHFVARLRELATKHPQIVEVRGKGLMIGVELNQAGAPVVAGMLEKGIICGPAGTNVVRFLPPLIVSNEEIDHVVDALDAVLATLS